MPEKPEIECPLRKLREITGKSQVDFARALGCSPSTIRKIERGEDSKLNPFLIMTAAAVFSVAANSLVPPSKQPTRLHGEPYTKEFFEDWWKNGPKLIESIIQQQKALLVRDFELVLTAAMRLPGMSYGGVMASFNQWLFETMHKFQLLPHYETEWKERRTKAKGKPKTTQADWELVKLFVENKSKFIQEAFEADISPTMFSYSLSEIRKLEMKNELEPDLFKKPKAEQLKLMTNFGTKVAKKTFQEPPPMISMPKRTR